LRFYILNFTLKLALNSSAVNRPPSTVNQKFSMPFKRPITDKRRAKFEQVVQRRQPNLTVIIENVHDFHNIGAVLRSCDSVGIMEIFVLYSDAHLTKNHLALGKRSSGGARKWVDVHFYTDVDACFEHVKSKYPTILATHLTTESKDLYELDLTQPVALLFGNEHKGVSEAALAYTDGNFTIPQMGMVESLNISVACAVTLYEAMRQRKEAGFYDKNTPLSDGEKAELFTEYRQRHEDRLKPKKVARKNA
ncbi:MAG: TrmH family RNA methyltransferase, partial [Saprospiraceae bacterium]